MARRGIGGIFIGVAAALCLQACPAEDADPGSDAGASAGAPDAAEPDAAAAACEACAVVQGRWLLEDAKAYLPTGDAVPVHGPQSTCDLYAFDMVHAIVVDEAAATLEARSDTCEAYPAELEPAAQGELVVRSGWAAVAGATVRVVDAEHIELETTTRVAAVDGPLCVGGTGDVDFRDVRVVAAFSRTAPDHGLCDR